MSDQSTGGTTAAGISLSQVVGMLTKEPLAEAYSASHTYMAGSCLAGESLRHRTYTHICVRMLSIFQWTPQHLAAVISPTEKGVAGQEIWFPLDSPWLTFGSVSFAPWPLSRTIPEAKRNVYLCTQQPAACWRNWLHCGNALRLEPPPEEKEKLSSSF